MAVLKLKNDKLVGVGAGKEGEKIVTTGNTGGAVKTRFGTIDEPTRVKRGTTGTTATTTQAVKTATGYGNALVGKEGEKVVPGGLGTTTAVTPTQTTPVQTTANQSVYKAGDAGHDANNALIGVTTDQKTGNTLDPNGKPINGIQLRDWTTDKTDWLSLAKNAGSTEEMHQYLYNHQLQSEAQGRPVDKNAVSEATNAYYANRPVDFKAADGSVKSGYYGQDENGVYGYFKDPQRTQKWEGEFDVRPGTLGYLKETDPYAYSRAIGDITPTQIKAGEPVNWTDLATGKTGTGAPAGYDPEGKTTAERLGGTTGAGESPVTPTTQSGNGGSGGNDGNGITGGVGGGTGGGVPSVTGGQTVNQTQNSAIDDLVNKLMSLYGENGSYAQALAAQQAAQQAATQQAINDLEGQKSSIGDQYAAMYRQLYRDNMNSQKNLDQVLAAQGLTGGAAESTRLGYATSYADALRQGEEQRIAALNELDRAIVNAQLSGDISSAEAAAAMQQARTDNYASVLRTLINRGDTLAAQEWQRQYQLGRDAVNDSRYNDELAYSRYRDTVGDRRYADETAYSRYRDTVGDARYADELAYSRAMQEAQQTAQAQQSAYAQALNEAKTRASLGDYGGYADLGFDVSGMTQTRGYTPTFSVAQLQKELDYARKNGTALSPTALRDYEYYYGAPYNTGGVPKSGTASGGVSDNNAGLTNSDVASIQAAYQALGYNIAADGYWGPDSQAKTGIPDAATAREALAYYAGRTQNGRIDSIA